MLTFLITLAISLSVPSASKPIHVDVVELNTFTNDGLHHTEQLLLRRWMRTAHGWNHHVANWRLIKDKKNLVITTVGDHKKVTFLDDGISRVMFTKSLIETHTAFDPELADRDLLDQLDRAFYFPQ